MNTSLVSSSSSSIFNFNAEHNGVPCIVSTRPEDQGSEQQVWFTRQMLCCVFGVKSLNTIDNHVDTLVNTGDGLPEELWEYTDELSDCIEKVHGEVFQYLRSIDKTDDYPF